MRQAFAACIAFAVLVVVVAVRFGFKDSPTAVPTPPIADAAITAAPIDAAPIDVAVLDAAPTPKKHAPKPIPKRTRPAPKPTSQPTPAIPPPVIATPGRPRCTPPSNPVGCPATEPNINRPCDADGVHCVYGTSCCPPVYVCNNGAFEAWFTRCP